MKGVNVMARLIDADKFFEDFKNVSFMNVEGHPMVAGSVILMLLDAQPTAYNVEKVVEELSREFKPILTEKKGFLGISQLVVSGYEINPSKAIDIVRRGGVNE